MDEIVKNVLKTVCFAARFLLINCIHMQIFCVKIFL